MMCYDLLSCLSILNSLLGPVGDDEPYSQWCQSLWWRCAMICCPVSSVFSSWFHWCCWILQPALPVAPWWSAPAPLALPATTTSTRCHYRTKHNDEIVCTTDLNKCGAAPQKPNASACVHVHVCMHVHKCVCVRVCVCNGVFVCVDMCMHNCAVCVHACVLMFQRPKELKLTSSLCSPQARQDTDSPEFQDIMHIVSKISQTVFQQRLVCSRLSHRS